MELSSLEEASIMEDRLRTAHSALDLLYRAFGEGASQEKMDAIVDGMRDCVRLIEETRARRIAARARWATSGHKSGQTGRVAPSVSSYEVGSGGPIYCERCGGKWEKGLCSTKGCFFDPDPDGYAEGVARTARGLRELSDEGRCDVADRQERGE